MPLILKGFILVLLHQFHLSLCRLLNIAVSFSNNREAHRYMHQLGTKVLSYVFQTHSCNLYFVLLMQTSLKRLFFPVVSACSCRLHNNADTYQSIPKPKQFLFLFLHFFVELLPLRQNLVPNIYSILNYFKVFPSSK